MAEETEDTENEEGGEEQAAKGSKKKLWIIIGGVVVLLLAVGTPIAFMALKKPAAEVGHADGHAAQDHEGLVLEGFEDEDEYEEDEEPLGAIFPMETFVLNLTGGGYLRLQAQVEFHNRNVPRRFYARLVVIRDGLILLLTKRSKDELSGENGKIELKEDMRDLINELLRKEEAKEIYFTQFVIQ